MTELPSKERQVKAQSFLWIVQTGLLALAAQTRRSDSKRNDELVAEYSGSGVFIRVDEAVRAASRIPIPMSAAEAAREFMNFYVGRVRHGAKRVPPHWFTRFGEEQHDYSLISKAEQFLWTVQTSVLADAENQANFDAAARKPERFGPVTTIETMSQAVRVASVIPSNLNATEAASEFLAFYAPGMKELVSPPRWCKDKGDGTAHDFLA